MMKYASDFEGYIKNKHICIYMYIYTHIYTHNYAYVMYIYLYITVYVCNIINICNIYIYILCMYIQTQKSSKVKPHHPTEQNMSRLWPTLSVWTCPWTSRWEEPVADVRGTRLVSQPLLLRIIQPEPAPTMNLWVYDVDFGIKFTGWLLHFFCNVANQNSQVLKVNMDECSGWWFSQILHQLI